VLYSIGEGSKEVTRRGENIMNAELVKDYGAPAYAIYEVMENGNYRLMYEGGDWMRAMEVYRIAIAEGKKAVIM
jgi:hypothetical protein